MENVLNVIEVANVISKMLFDDATSIASTSTEDKWLVQGTVDREDSDLIVELNGNMIEIHAESDVEGRLGMEIEFQILVEDATEDRIRKHMTYHMSGLDFY